MSDYGLNGEYPANPADVLAAHEMRFDTAAERIPGLATLALAATLAVGGGGAIATGVVAVHDGIIEGAQTTSIHYQGYAGAAADSPTLAAAEERADNRRWAPDTSIIGELATHRDDTGASLTGLVADGVYHGNVQAIEHELDQADYHRPGGE